MMMMTTMMMMMMMMMMNDDDDDMMMMTYINKLPINHTRGRYSIVTVYANAVALQTQAVGQQHNSRLKASSASAR
eukprot:12400375-Karenia_brevis.AAC.1